jgi:putative ABC transport system substrate-binding protein
MTLTLHVIQVVAILALLAVPLGAEAQPSKIVRIGYLSFFEPNPRDDVFRQELRHLGWIEGRNLVIEYRSAGRDPQRLRPLAAELVGLRVAVIVTTTGRAALVVKDATSTIPIVMTGSGDAVSQGLVAGLARPGGNVTGLTNISPETTSKRLEFLRETLPSLSRLAFLGCFDSPVGRTESQEVQAAATALGLQVQSIDVPSASGLGLALQTAVRQRAQALLVGDCPTSLPPRQVADLALQHRLPSMGPSVSLVQAGGLMSYGHEPKESYRRAATFVDKILRGAKPADLPVEQPTKFELVINMKTAKALGLTIPPAVLARADEVIQ